MPQTGVIFALVHDNKILMQQRDENCKKFPLMWCIPGGGTEEGEDYETTLLREIKEEYNLYVKLSDCTYCMDQDSEDGHSRVYVCKVHHNQTPVLQEGLAMKWMSLEEIQGMQLGFHQEEIVKTLQSIFKQ